MLLMPGPVFEMLLPGFGTEAEPPPVLFHHLDRAACHLRSVGVAEREPAVISSEFMKDIRPMRIGADAPCGIEGFRVEVGDTEAESGGGLEAAGRECAFVWRAGRKDIRVGRRGFPRTGR